MNEEEIQQALDKEEAEEKRVREILADGAKTEFWKEVKRLLTDLMEQALEELPKVTPERLAETQQMYKIPERIINIVEHYEECQDEIDKELMEEFKEREG